MPFQSQHVASAEFKRMNPGLIDSEVRPHTTETLPQADRPGSAPENAEGPVVADRAFSSWRGQDLNL